MGGHLSKEELVRLLRTVTESRLAGQVGITDAAMGTGLDSRELSR